jgi:hypothetical protein
VSIWWTARYQGFLKRLNLRHKTKTNILVCDLEKNITVHVTADKHEREGTECYLAYGEEK